LSLKELMHLEQQMNENLARVRTKKVKPSNLIFTSYRLIISTFFLFLQNYHRLFKFARHPLKHIAEMRGWCLMESGWADFGAIGGDEREGAAANLSTILTLQYAKDFACRTELYLSTFDDYI
jgi:hypothetical protein